MIHLVVSFDDTLVAGCAAGGARRAWAGFCRRHGVPDLAQAADAFLDHGPLTSADETAIARLSHYLQRRVESSVADAARLFPEVPTDVEHELTVAFVPCGTRMIGPRSGLQFFSLFPDADPVEAFLFLVHVYYHEISDLVSSDAAKNFSTRQHCARDLRRWLRLLIRNEGIGNYIVLPDLLEFRRTHPAYAFKYFGYAPQIGSDPLLSAAIHILNEVFSGVTDANLGSFRDNVNALLKSKALPVINLVGIHMAVTVAEAHGIAALRDVYAADPERFFELYAASGEPRAAAFSDVVIRDVAPPRSGAGLQ